jgi:hypothetical protein
MIANVIARAIRASGAFWAMIAGIVRGLSHEGSTRQNATSIAIVIAPRNHRSM